MSQVDFHTAFFTTLLKDFRMERPKIRETDKARWFSLSAFFLEFFNTKWRRKDISKIPEAEIEKAVRSVSCMVDPTTVGYVSARMALTIDDKVGCSALSVVYINFNNKQPPSWKELHCAINCLIQIVSTFFFFNGYTN